MKNLLLYNYNIDIKELNIFNDNIASFYIDYNKYYLINFHRVEKDIEFIYNSLSNRINQYHSIIKNKDGNIFTKDGEKKYILLKINGPENNEIDINDIIQSQISLDKKINSDLKRNNWGELWSEKVDYLEYQVSELSKNHPTVIKSFSYYVGLAENAIEYYNMLDVKYAPLVYAQRRIIYPNISKNYYNPLNLIVDYRVRDIAEYIKTQFFNGLDASNELKLLIDKNLLSQLEYNLLYSRLLYPSYYFDDINKILEQNETDDILIKYIDRVNEYEEYLKKIYYLLSQKCQMIKIWWIVDKN